MAVTVLALSKWMTAVLAISKFDWPSLCGHCQTFVLATTAWDGISAMGLPSLHWLHPGRQIFVLPNGLAILPMLAIHVLAFSAPSMHLLTTLAP